jgi:hypothetical protein
MASPYNSTDSMNTGSNSSAMTSGSQDDVQDSQDQQSQGQQSQGFQGQQSGLDVLRGSFTSAFDQIVKEIEPQINEFTSNIARQAIDKGQTFGKSAVSRVQSQSWGRIGLAAALILGGVAVLGYQAAEAIVDQNDLH